MKAAANPVQAALYALFTGDTGAGGISEVGGPAQATVRDVAAVSDLQGKVAWPYITIGEFSGSFNSTFTTDGELLRVTVNIWTKRPGMKQAFTILSRVNELIGDAKLTVTGYVLARAVFVNYTTVADPVNGIEHVVALYDVFLQEA